MESTTKDQIVIGATGVKLLIESLVEQIRRHCGLCGQVAIVGIQRGGVPLACRLYDELQKLPTLNNRLHLGSIDISINRDDLESRDAISVYPSEISFDIQGIEIILVDDVIESGRTTRAAIDSIMQLGRPKAIRLAALIDRGNRQLPIQPDFIGKIMTPKDSQVVELRLSDEDPQNNAIVILDTHQKTNKA